MDDERIELPKLEGHYCFACGTANPIGLNMHFYYSKGAVCSDIALGKYYEGWQNMAHGGIISAMLDEVMAWAIVYFKRVFFVTRKMEVKYLGPVEIGVPLKIKGVLFEDSDNGKVKTKGEILDNNGKVLAKAIAEFIILSDEKLELIPMERRAEMYELFERLPPVSE